jgi:uncharacterized membrane protein YhaH (DUF805 family)
MEWMLLPLKRYADFSGRSRRKEYWMFVLLNTIVILFLVMVGVIGAGTSGEESALLVIAIVLGVLWALGTVIPGLAVQVRRFHDQDKSGWFVLLGFIPYLGGLIVLVFMLFEGTAGANRFGPDPKDRMEGQLGLSG